MKKINYEDYIGKKINRLTILKKVCVDKQYGAILECKCDCGNIICKPGYYVRYGFTKSCGCLKKEASKENYRNMGLKNRKHEEKCDYCGKEEHYSLGYCKACYNRLKRNGVLEIHKKGRKNAREIVSI